jgi:MFS family permease
VLLGLTLVTAFLWMKDWGFTPARGRGLLVEVRKLIRESLDAGWGNPPVRWLMLAALFTGGVSIFGFYAMQPYLLQLYGDPGAFGIAGLSAAIVAGTEMAAGLLAPRLHGLIGRRTDTLIITTAIGTASILGMGLVPSFPVAIGLLVVWGLTFSVAMPIRQAYINGIIPSAQRATVLSFDSLMGSAGGVVAQPALGRVADLFGYSRAYVVSGLIQLAALPFLALARRERAESDLGGRAVGRSGGQMVGR